VFYPRQKNNVPSPEEFKRTLEEQLEKKSPNYIQDIGKHRWETKFYSELITLVGLENSLFLDSCWIFKTFF
jgi:hypothetical protein